MWDTATALGSTILVDGVVLRAHYFGVQLIQTLFDCREHAAIYAFFSQRIELAGTIGA